MEKVISKGDTFDLTAEELSEGFQLIFDSMKIPGFESGKDVIFKAASSFSPVMVDTQK